MPGLAHFLEHLLFCGSQRFPKENEYKEYIKSRGGHCNAYTSPQNTNYHFAVAADAFLGALERFSSVFERPLFSPSSTAREINAVNSENSKNQQSDGRRLHQLMKSLSDGCHPWNKFGCGSKDTLSRGGEGWHDSEVDGGPAGRETRRRLIEWWETHYCTNRMRLVLVGRGNARFFIWFGYSQIGRTESLDSLASMAASNFSSIPNRALDRSPLVNSPPWSTPGVPVRADGQSLAQATSNSSHRKLFMLNRSKTREDCKSILRFRSRAVCTV
jgi:insulysin